MRPEQRADEVKEHGVDDEGEQAEGEDQQRQRQQHQHRPQHGVEDAEQQRGHHQVQQLLTVDALDELAATSTARVLMSQLWMNRFKPGAIAARTFASKPCRANSIRHAAVLHKPYALAGYGDLRLNG